MNYRRKGLKEEALNGANVWWSDPRDLVNTARFFTARDVCGELIGQRDIDRMDWTRSDAGIDPCADIDDGWLALQRRLDPPGPCDGAYWHVIVTHHC